MYKDDYEVDSRIELDIVRTVTIDDSALELITWMLQEDPCRRPTLSQILSSPFLRS